MSQYPVIAALHYGVAGAAGHSALALPIAACAALALVTGIWVVGRERGRPISLPFLAGALALTLYLFSFSRMLDSQDAARALIWAKLAYVGVPFIIPALYHFSMHVLGLARARRRLVHAAWLVGIGYSLAAVLTDSVVAGVHRTEWGWFTRLTPGSLLFVAWSALLFGLTMLDYAREYRGADPVQRARIRWFAVPLCIAGFGFIDYAPSYGVDMAPLGFVFFPAFLLSAAWVVNRYHLPQITPQYAADKILQTMAEPLLVCDPGGRVVIANPAARRILGYDDGGLRAMHLPAVFGEADAERILGGEVRRESREMRVRTRGGDVIDVAVSAGTLRSRTGQAAGIVVVARDIREEKRAAAELGRREQWFRALIENAGDMITVLDEEGRVRYESPAVTRNLGYTPASGASLYDRVHPDDRERLQKGLARLLAAPGTSATAEARVRHVDGSYRVFQARSTNLLHDPAVRGIVINSRDVTDARDLEVRLQQSRKLEAIGRLAGGVAHDFNNILTAIQGYVELMAERVAPDSDLATDLDEVRRGAARAARLTDQLLAFSRRKMAPARVLDLNGIVAELESMLSRVVGERIRLRTRLDPHGARIRADRAQLEQVLMDLVLNARAAIAGDGTIEISTALTELGPTHPLARELGEEPGRYVVLSVADDGRGMDDAIRARIFEPFYTTKAAGDGNGLGLSTVYGWVRQSGGAISVDSEPGRGSVFRVFLPAHEAHEAHETDRTVETDPPVEADRSVETGAPRGGEAPGARPARDQHGATILVVEDEAPIRALLRKILQRRGYTVLEAADGQEALRSAADHRGRIDLLVADLVMPGLSGREVAERFAASRPDTPILFISGYTSDDVVRRGIADGAHAFLPKPFTPEALVQKVAEVLGPQAA